MTTFQEVTLESSGNSADWLTMRKRIEQEIHKPGHVDQINISMITAMRWYEHMEFYFNQDTHEFTLTLNQQSYPKEDGASNTDSWPEDIERIVDTYVKVGGERWLKLNQVDIDDIRWLTPTAQVVGVPDYYAYFAEKVWLSPIPNDSSVDTVRIDYIKDLGIPNYAFVGSTWKFFQPGSQAPLLNSFTNRWLSDAEELIRTRAKYDLYQHYYDDAENAQKMAQHESVALGNLRSKQQAHEAEMERSPTYI